MDNRKREGRAGALVAVLLLGLVGVAGLGYFYGYVRAAIGLALAGLVAYLGISYFRAAGSSPPDTGADFEEGRDEELTYVCKVCSLELKVTGGKLGAPPTHCREKMVLVRSGGLHPL